MNLRISKVNEQTQLSLVGDNESQNCGNGGEDSQSDETVSGPPPHHVDKQRRHKEQLGVDADVMSMSETLEK